MPTHTIETWGDPSALIVTRWPCRPDSIRATALSGSFAGDVRVVAATNKDLNAAVEQGEFRRDLFFRLAVFPVNIPPLRERGDDLSLLAISFAAQLGKELRGREVTLGAKAIKALESHNWPGNVRELENTIERACILSDSSELEPKDLGLPISSPGADALQSLDLSGTLSEVAHRAVSFVERRKIEQALKANNGNKGLTAEKLGISYKTLLTKIKDYDL